MTPETITALPSKWCREYWMCGSCGKTNCFNRESCDKCGLGTRPVDPIPQYIEAMEAALCEMLKLEHDDGKDWEIAVTKLQSALQLAREKK